MSAQHQAPSLPSAPKGGAPESYAFPPPKNFPSRAHPLKKNYPRLHITPARPARSLGVGRSLARFSRHERPTPSALAPVCPQRGRPRKLRFPSSIVFLLAHIPRAKSLSAHGARDIGFAKKITDTPDFLSHTLSTYISSLHYYHRCANNNQIAWRFFLLLALYFLLAVQHGAGSAFTSAPAQKAQPRPMLPPPARSVAWWSVALGSLLSP